MPAGSSLVTAFDFVWDRLTDRLSGLTDDEYFWEPVPGCWTLRPDSTGRWVLDGAGTVPDPDIEPLPLTTIAWRIGHLAGAAVGGFAERRFGADRPAELPRHASEVPDFLEAAYGAWRAGMVGLSAEAWEEPLGPAWGPYAASTTFDLSLHVLDEVVHHGAEVALLRDLYVRLGPAGYGRQRGHPG